MQGSASSQAPIGGEALVPGDSFDAKRDLGRPLLRRLQRARASLLLARKLHLPGRQRMANAMWQSFLGGSDSSFLARAPSSVTGNGGQECTTWHDLKYWTFIASCFEQHHVYEALLQAYDDVVPLSASPSDVEAFFFGSGHGRSTLNTYRSMHPQTAHRGESWRFEKVYNNEYDDFSRVVFLEENAGGRLRSRGVVLPLVQDAVSGNRITIAYSDLVTGRRLGTRAALERSAEVIEMLMEIPVVGHHYDGAMSRYHVNGIEAFTNARQWLLSRKPEYSEAFDHVAASIDTSYPRFFAHGDLHRKNMLSSGAVLDWDNGGIYPIGFDPGMILSKSIRGGTLQELEATVKRYFVRGVARDYEHFLVHAALFYGFVFGAGKKSPMPESLLMEMLEKALTLSPGKVA